MSVFTITRNARTMGWVNAGDEVMTELSCFTEDIDMNPDKFDIEDGLTTHVAKAIDFLRHSAYVIEASVYPYENARRGTWLWTEDYTHPYTSDVEETTYSFNGDWTDEEIREIVVAVLTK